jgi:hypothetical protein
MQFPVPDEQDPEKGENTVKLTVKILKDKSDERGT